MAQIIKLRRSSTAGKVPTTSDLNLGELAINTNDGRIFFEKNDGSAAIKHVITSDSQTTGSIEITGNISGSTIYASGNTTLVGNVGIGVTSPAKKLHVDGTIRTGPIWFYNADTTLGGYIADGANMGAGYTSDDLVIRAVTDIGFLTNDASTKAMILKSDGKVGIGTTTPGTKLQVSGSLNISQQTIPSTVTTALDFTDSNNFKVTLGTNTTLSSSNEASAIGSTGVVVLVQDGTGGRTVALPATWKTPKGQSISFDTGANDINIISYYVIDASTVAVNYIGDFS